MATDSTEARTRASGHTGPRRMGSSLSGYKAMALNKPQLMVFLVQDTWVPGLKGGRPTDDGPIEATATVSGLTG